MSAAPGARDSALHALVTFRRNGGRGDPGFRAADKREEALARTIFWGVLQNMSLLDFYISSYSRRALQTLEPLLLDILRIGVYQVLFLDRVPAHAAVHETVDQTKRHVNEGAAKLANAVMRRIQENRDTLPEPPRTDMASYLSVRYSHPEWLCRKLLSMMPGSDCESFLEANNRPAPLTIQTNTLRTDRDRLLRELCSSGLEAEPHVWEPGTINIAGGADPLAISAFIRGLATVQDPAARLAVTAAQLFPGARVIDPCAAPGGKSFAAAMDMNNTGEILSFDLSTKKIPRIEQGARRLGIDIIRAEARDAREYDPRLDSTADAVIADVPCSGLGTIRKKPQIRYKTEEEISGLPAIQLSILENVSRYVKPGGVLVYSTCTVLPEENDGVTGCFLDSHREFTPEDFPVNAHETQSLNGAVTLWPHRDCSDGFYIRKMRRR